MKFSLLYFISACAAKIFDYVVSVNTATFSEKVSCSNTNYQASKAHPSQTYFWKDCNPGDNYLQVDLKEEQFVFTLVAYGDTTGSPHQFTLKYSSDNVDWRDVLNADSTTHVRPFFFIILITYLEAKRYCREV